MNNEKGQGTIKSNKMMKEIGEGNDNEKLMEEIRRNNDRQRGEYNNVSLTVS